MTTVHWRDMLVDRAALDELYTDIPGLERVALRSIHLDRVGPTVILRCDLPEFPDRVAVADDHHRLQLHLRFLDVADFNLLRCELPAEAAVTLGALERRRLAVEVVGGSVEMTFSASDSLAVGHLSTHRGTASEPDVGEHSFLGAVDRRRYSSVPSPTVKVFHDRL